MKRQFSRSKNIIVFTIGEACVAAHEVQGFVNGVSLRFSLRLLRISFHQPSFSLFLPSIISGKISFTGVHPSVWLSTSDQGPLASYLGKICPTVQALQGPCAIFFSIHQRSNYVFITLLVHFISDQESGRVFNRLSNRTHRQFVALTTVCLILNISNPSTFCPILNNSEHNTVTFSPLSGSWYGWPLAPRSTSSRRPSAACGVSIPTAVASEQSAVF